MNKNRQRGRLPAALVMAALLAGCGGGGDGDSEAGWQGAWPGAQQRDVLRVACTGCGAAGPNTYAGQGVGIWERRNDSDEAQAVPVWIGGFTGQDVTLVVTSQTTHSERVPALAQEDPQPLPAPQAAMADPREAAQAQAQAIHQRIADFNRSGWARLLATEPQQRAAAAEPAAARVLPALGSTRTYKDVDFGEHETTLMRRATVSDGRVVNLWVETSEQAPDKVTPEAMDELFTAFVRPGGAHDMVRDVGGPLWGPHAYPSSFLPGDQPLDMVLMNFTPDGVASGVRGFFWSLNNFRRSARPDSNESLAIFLDTETMYLQGRLGQRTLLSVLAHETMHMSNFYRRGVRMGEASGFPVWLEEMSAMMMEDVASTRIDPGFNTIRDLRVPRYLSGPGSNCPLLAFHTGGTCEAYSTAAPVGAFLLRQLGVPFFRDLLREPGTQAVKVMDAAIARSRPGSSLREELPRFAASALGGLPPGAPAGYGFPARAEQGFRIPAIDMSALQSGAAQLPRAPRVLRALGSYALQRPDVRGVLSERVQLPPGATLTVVAH